MNDFLKDQFTFRGRLARMPFFLRWITLLVSFVLVFVGMATMTGGNTTAIIVLLGPVCIAWIAASLSLVVRRLHDMDLSGWWYLLAIPYQGILKLIGTNADGGFLMVLGLIGLLPLAFLLFKEGTQGANRFDKPTGLLLQAAE